MEIIKVEMSDEMKCQKDKKRWEQEISKKAVLGMWKEKFFPDRRKEERIGRDRKYKMESRQFSGVHGGWPQSSL